MSHGRTSQHGRVMGSPYWRFDAGAVERGPVPFQPDFVVVIAEHFAIHQLEHARLLPFPESSIAGTAAAESLGNRDGLKVAVIVNDTSEVNIDAQLVKNGSAALSRVDERLVEMQNG
jgi:CobW/HypB/UreG, nucleotide-binding domain